MMMNRFRKILVIVVSTVFLILFLNSDRIFGFLNSDVMSVPVLSENKVSDICSHREMLQQDWLLTYDEYPVTYDEASNTIYIPQALGEDSEWEGNLAAETGRLYFVEDEYWDKRSEAISEGHAFELYQVTKDTYSEYQVVFTGMPIMNLLVEKCVDE